MRLTIFIILAIFTLSATVAAEIRVIDGDTIDIDGQRHRIHGIDAPERDQRCGAAAGDWRCGVAATRQLQALVSGREVTCDARQLDAYGRFISFCRAEGDDLGAQMVRDGMAWAFVRYSDDYVAQEQLAREERLGVWRGRATPAWEHRAKSWRAAAATAPEGCAIKGNISDRGRIYHTPWSRSYARTRINLAKGERWFCDEAEALAAGWRAPLR